MFLSKCNSWLTPGLCISGIQEIQGLLPFYPSSPQHVALPRPKECIPLKLRTYQWNLSAPIDSSRTAGSLKLTCSFFEQDSVQLYLSQFYRKNAGGILPFSHGKNCSIYSRLGPQHQKYSNTSQLSPVKQTIQKIEKLVNLLSFQQASICHAFPPPPRHRGAPYLGYLQHMKQYSFPSVFFHWKNCAALFNSPHSEKQKSYVCECVKYQFWVATHVEMCLQFAQ